MSASTLTVRDVPSLRATHRDLAPLRREALPDAVDDRLLFAQVREDPRVELEALAPTAADTVVVVSSGGCTALSLLAAGAGRVVAVDRNATQNHVVELKVAAAALGSAQAIAFLGGQPSGTRRETYALLRGELTPSARRFWDARPRAVAGGVLSAGVSERFIGTVVSALRLFVHPPARIARLLACASVDEQRALFDREWNTRRWRALFVLLCNRLMFRGSYPPAFFTHLGHASFAAHFRGVADHAITELPVRDNYFLHQMLTGRYPAGADGGVPPYLSEAGSVAVASKRDALTLVDGGMTSYLRTCADRSVACFGLSNICEWMSDREVEALFREIMRTAAPGARLVYRNFLGWTEPPADCLGDAPRAPAQGTALQRRLVADPALGDRLIQADRSVMQRRVVACRIVEAS